MTHSPGENTVQIDGSYGEGGGQILRTSLALSCAHGRPFEIINIRKARKKPGLQPQHLTAVRAAAAISHARIQGDELFSTSLRFSPGAVTGGEYLFDVSERKGSAGSVTLVLQTILLPLSLAGQPSSIAVIGGTHVPWSPTFHYFKLVFLPMLSRIGMRADIDIEQWGWYPAGGGRVQGRVHPLTEFRPVILREREKPVRISGISATANLPRDIAVRQRDRALQALAQRGIDAEVEIVTAPSAGKGTLVFLLAEYENVLAGFDSLGAIGKRAEEVADEACRGLFDYMDKDGALDPHLADQIVPYLAMARGTSEFTTSRISQHLLTNIWVVKQFMDVEILVEGKEGEEGQVRICPVRNGMHGSKGS